MRNTYTCCDGDPVVGRIIYGEKFPFGTVSEETYTADMAVLNGSVAALADSVETVDGKANTLAENITGISGNVAAVNAALIEIRSDIAENTAGISSILATVGGHASDIAEISENLRGVWARIDATSVSLTSLTGDLSSVETRVSALSSRVDSSVSRIENAVSGLQNDVNTHQQEISSLKTASASAVSAIVETENNIRAVSSRVDGVAQAVSSVGNNVSSLEASLDALAARTTSDVQRIDRAVTAVQSDSVEIKRDITELKAKVSALESASAEGKSAVQAVSNRMANYETVMNVLRNQILNVSDNMNDRCEGLSNGLVSLRQSVNELSKTVGELSVNTAVSIATINQRLENLEGGEAIGILSFSASPSVCEKGANENVILSWTTKGDVKSAKINGETVTGNSKTVPNVSSAQEYTLVVTDAKGISDQKKITVPFINHIYWGTDPSGLMTEGTVKGLDYGELSDTVTRSLRITVDNSYVYYSYPKRLGTVQFKVGQFVGGFSNPASVVIDNHSGYAEEYYVYRSNQILGVDEPVSLAIDVF